MSEQHSKPNVSPSQAADLVKKHYNLTPSQTKDLPSYEDQNFHVVTLDGGQYLLKIMNSEDSKDPTLFELQTYAMTFLEENGLPTQTAVKTTAGQGMFLENLDCGYGRRKYLVRLLTYLPGIPIAKVPFSPQLLYQVGQTAATMDTILKEMKHPQLSVLRRKDFIWDLSNLVLLEKYMHVLDGDPLQEVVKTVLHQYKTFVAPKYAGFRKCLIHGDFNDLNVLVEANDGDGHRISGIIDFVDMHMSYYVHELAITLTYMMLEHAKPVEVGGPILAGWESVFPLNEEEKVCLFWKGVPILCRFLEMGKEQVEKVWFQSAAQFDSKNGK